MNATRARRSAIVAVALLDVLGWGLSRGWAGVAGATLAIAMLVLFFAGSLAPKTFADIVGPGVLFTVIATGYVARVLLLLIVLIRVGDATWLSRDAVGGTVIVGALCWSAALVHQQLTSRQPTLVIAPAAPRRTGDIL